MTFIPAVRKKAKLKMALSGPPGAGKTLTALRLATALAGETGKVAMIDTEHGSGSRYVDLNTPDGQLKYDVLELANFNAKFYINGIREAVQNGYDVLIIDSLSHAWNGVGGILESVEQGDGKNKFANWKPADRMYRLLVETILGAPIHIICTTRSKMAYAEKQTDRGRTYEKVGMAPIMRDGIEYEFDIFGELDVQNNLVFSKTRCADLADMRFTRAGGDVVAVINRWLDSGTAPVVDSMPDPDTFERGGGMPDGSTFGQKATESLKVSAMRSSLQKCSTTEELDGLASQLAGWDKAESSLLRGDYLKARNRISPAAGTAPQAEAG